MAEYHVNCGLFGIYAGTVNKPKKDGTQTWREKNDVTDEVLCAARDYLVMKAQENKKNAWGYEWDRKDGKVVELIVKIRDKESEGE